MGGFFLFISMSQPFRITEKKLACSTTVYRFRGDWGTEQGDISQVPGDRSGCTHARTVHKNTWFTMLWECIRKQETDKEGLVDTDKRY